MAGVRMDVKQLGSYMRKLGDAFMPAILSGLTATAVYSQRKLIAESDRKKVMNNGGYKRSWRFDRAMRMGAAKAEVRVFNFAPYSGVIELGRRPGRKMPWLRGKTLNEQPLFLWARSKFGASDEEAAKIAWAVAWAIKRRGIPGKHVVGGVLGHLGRVGQAELVEALDRAVAQVRP
jgi:hypothetical protein